MNNLKHKEKRVYPRVSTHLPAVITNQDGQSLKVVASEASVDGFCIQCTMMERNLITPGGSFIRDGRPVELDAWLDLPSAGKAKAAMVKARCHVSFSRRLARDSCFIGVRYLDADEEMRQKIVQFIEHSLAANVD